MSLLSSSHHGHLNLFIRYETAPVQAGSRPQEYPQFTVTAALEARAGWSAE
jgi:hypothetical protein